MLNEAYSEEGGAAKWQRRIKDVLDSDSWGLRVKKIKESRKYVSGDMHTDGAPGLVRTNLIFSSMATMLPYTYARDPDVTVSPSESTDPSMYGVVKRFTETLQQVLYRQVFVDGRMKAKIRGALRSEWTTGIGAVKITYQRDMDTDPLIQNRINDAQDNVSRLMRLAESTEDQSKCTDYEAEIEEIKLQITALEQEVEVTAAEGLCIDNIMSEDLLILDDTVKVFEDYSQARAIAHGIWYEQEEYEEIFGALDSEGGTAIFNEPNDNQNAPHFKQDNKVKKFIRVWEIWDKVSQTVYTIAQGGKGYCRDPFQPQKTGERWYPIFILGFNAIDGQFMPLSPVSLGTELQDEYNTTRTNYAEHRKESLPTRVFRAGGNLDEDDIKALKNRQSGDWTAIKGNPAVPIQQDIAILPNPPLDPAVYDTTAIRNDLDLVYGMTDASRSVLIEEKTLGEAEIMKEGMNTRIADRRDMMEDVLREGCQYSAEILLQELTLEQVKQIAGQNAVWPDLYKPDIFNMVSVQIKAGSSGKPDKKGEQERWVKVYPLIKEAVLEIKMMEAQGQPQIGAAYRMLLEETLSRFDERIDLNAYLGPKPHDMMMPGLPSGEPMVAGAPPQPGPMPGGPVVPGAGGPTGPGADPPSAPAPALPMLPPMMPPPMPAPPMDGGVMGLLGGTMATIQNDLAHIKVQLAQSTAGVPLSPQQPSGPPMPEGLEIKRLDDGSLVGRRGSKTFLIKRQPDGSMSGSVTSAMPMQVAG